MTDTTQTPIAILTAADWRDALQMAGLTQGTIVRQSGLNASTISRICQGKYPSDSDAVQTVLGIVSAALTARGLALDTILSQRTDAAQPAALAAVPSAPGPVVALAAARLPDAPPSLGAPWGGAYCTDGQRLMWAMLRAIHEDRELGVLVSLSGTGKSHLIDRFGEQYPGTLIYRPLRGISQSGIMEDLCRLFGLPYSGSNDTRRRRLLDGCAGRTLIVDEADLLIAGRYATQAVDRLEIYRQLQERGCAVALVGLPALLHTILRGGETYVFSRIGYARQAPVPTDTELAAYWRAQISGYPQAHAKAGLVAIGAGKHGYLRYLDKLARRTRDQGGDVAAAETLLFRGEQA